MTKPLGFGGNLLFCLWLWHRAQPGSGDAMVLPTVVVLSAAMLLGILPRLFWPAAVSLHIAGTIANVLVVTVLLGVQIRNRRRLRRASRPVKGIDVCRERRTAWRAAGDRRAARGGVWRVEARPG